MTLNNNSTIQEIISVINNNPTVHKDGRASIKNALVARGNIVPDANGDGDPTYQELVSAINGSLGPGSKLSYKKLTPSVKPVYEHMDSQSYLNLKFLNYDKYTQQFVMIRKDYNQNNVYIYVYDKYLTLIKSVTVSLSSYSYQAEIAFYRNNRFYVVTDGGSQFGARTEVFSDDGLTRLTTLTNAGARICAIAKYPIQYIGSSIQYFSTADSLVYIFDFSLNNPTLRFTPPFSMSIASGGGYYQYIEALQLHCFTDFASAYFRVYSSDFSLVFNGGTNVYTAIRDSRFPFYHTETDAIYGMYSWSNGNYYWIYWVKISKTTYQVISSVALVQQVGSSAMDSTYHSQGSTIPKYYSGSKKYYTYLSGLGRVFAFGVNNDGTIKGFETGTPKDVSYLLNPANVEAINYVDYPEKNLVAMGIPQYYDETIMMFINNDTTKSVTNKTYHTEYTIK